MLGPEGIHGADRITRNAYDAADTTSVLLR